MISKDLELLLRAELAAAQILDALLERIFSDRGEEEARAEIKRIAEMLSDDSAAGLNVFATYRGMRASLDEQDFLWGASQEMPSPVLHKLRQSRRRQYLHYLEMFELNVRLTRASRRSTMSLDADWSLLESYVSDGAHMFKYRTQLRFAAELFRWDRPGAIDCCDAAVFGILQLIYLRPSPSAV